MKKKIAILLIISIFTFLIGGCSSRKSENKTLDINVLKSDIEKSIDMSKLKAETRERFEKLYKIEDADIEDVIFYKSDSNLKADELVILKLKDKNKMKNVKEKMEYRIEKQSNTFKDYLPKEYELVTTNILKVEDNYILLVISSDADKVEKAFEKAIE